MKNQLNPRVSAALPKRALVPVLIPFAVFACTLSLIIWSGWPVLQPSRSIEITQAIPVQSSSVAIEPDRFAPRGGPPKSTRTVQAAGWLEAEPFYTAASALTDGVIDQMLVLEGDFVEVGQVLARMIDHDARLRLSRDEAELLRALAILAEARAFFVAAEQNWATPYELERAVSSGRASLAEREAELLQLSALIRIEKATLAQADAEFKSIEQAYHGAAATEIEFVTARERAVAQRAQLEAIQGRELIIRSAIDRIRSDLFAAERAIELRIEDRARLDAARASVAHAEASVTLREAQRAESRLELERMTIRSPMTGYVQRRLKAPGDKVVRMMDDAHSSHIAHLYDPSRLQVRVDVPLADASQVYVGQKCEVVVEVLADRVFVGEIIRITHEADLQKNTLQVKVRVIDPDPLLRPEMLTRVKFLPDETSTVSAHQSIEKTHEMVRVPRGSIDGTSGTHRIWQIVDRANGRGVLNPVGVTIISTDGDWVTVQGDLPSGAVIASDPSGCVEGGRVRLNPVDGGAS